MEQGAECYRRFLGGDQSAFNEIVHMYRDPLTFFIQRYVHDLPAAEDLAIDVFMELVVHPKRYNEKYSLKTYLFMLARSRALDLLRSRKRHETFPLEQTEETLADEQELEEQFLKEERARQLHQAIGKLPEEQQTAVHLVYFEEMSYADAAKIMKKSAKQIDNLLYRAKQTLRGLLGEDGEPSV